MRSLPEHLISEGMQTEILSVDGNMKPVINYSIQNSTAGTIATVSTILFDLDNTLLATREIDQSACTEVQQWLCTHGVSSHTSSAACNTFLSQYRQNPAPDEGSYKELQTYRRNIWYGVLKQYDLQHLAGEVFCLWKQSRLRRLQLSAATWQLLTELDDEYSIAIITNGPSAAQWEKIEACGLQSLVRSIVVSGDLRAKKPGKEIYRQACRQLGVSPEECIMVGDKLETDILGGVNAGLAATVLVGTTHWLSSSIPPDGEQPSSQTSQCDLLSCCSGDSQHFSEPALNSFANDLPSAASQSCRGSRDFFHLNGFSQDRMKSSTVPSFSSVVRNEKIVETYIMSSGMNGHTKESLLVHSGSPVAAKVDNYMPLSSPVEPCNGFGTNDVQSSCPNESERYCVASPAGDKVADIDVNSVIPDFVLSSVCDLPKILSFFRHES